MYSLSKCPLEGKGFLGSCVPIFETSSLWFYISRWLRFTYEKLKAVIQFNKNNSVQIFIKSSNILCRYVNNSSVFGSIKILENTGDHLIHDTVSQSRRLDSLEKPL